MSGENVETARRGYAVVNRAYAGEDLGAVEADLAEIVAPEVVLRGGVLAAGEEWRGIDGLLRFFRHQREAFETMRLEPVELIDAADDKMIGVLRIVGRARYTGLDIDLPVFHVATFADGRLARLDTYTTRADALAAAGVAG